MKSSLPSVKTQIQVHAHIVRTENGMEFLKNTLNSLLDHLRIIHQMSCVYTPQQNEVVERKHRHLLSVARSLQFQASLPIKFWGDSLLTATYLINRLPIAILDYQTPIEILMGSPPYTHLRTYGYGCLCNVSTLAHNRTKFDPRASKCVYLGYPFGRKGCRVFGLSTQQFHIRRDVVFHETQFPFQDISTTSSSSINCSLFPPYTDPFILQIDDSNSGCPVFSETNSSLNSSLSPSLDISNSNVISSSLNDASTDVSHASPSINKYVSHRSKRLPAKFEDYTALPSMFTQSLPTSAQVS